MSAAKNKTILILGGGFGGLKAARELGRRKGAEVVLVDRVKHHLYTPLLYEVASGCMSANGMASGKELTLGTTISFDRLLKSCCGVKFVQGEVVKIDPAGQAVELASGTKLPFHTLIVALGSETDYYGIPGLKENSYALKTRADALLIRQRIQEFIEKKKKREEVQIQIVVGGGGATGVEFSAELANCFRRMVRLRQISDGDWSVTLVEASSRLLGMLKPEVSELVLRRLASLGVKVLRDTCIKRATERGVVLAPRPLKPGESVESLVCDFRSESEKRFEADVIIWTGGVRSNAIVATANLPMDPKGRLMVDDKMRVQGAKNIYAIGDCASLVDPKTKRPVPQLAQSAVEMADIVARNIVRAIFYKLPPTSYKPREYPAIIPLGAKSAVAVIGRFVAAGRIGWCLRQAADLRYYIGILPFWSALHFWWHGAKEFSKND